MTKFNWDRVSKENLDFRHRAKKDAEGTRNEPELQRIQSCRVSLKNSAVDDFTSCPKCGVSLKKLNLNKHIRKIHGINQNVSEDELKRLQSEFGKQVKGGQQIRNTTQDNVRRFTLVIECPDEPNVFNFVISCEKNVDTHYLRNDWLLEAVEWLARSIAVNGEVLERYLNETVRNLLEEIVSEHPSPIINAKAVLELGKVSQPAESLEKRENGIGIIA